MVVTRGHQHDLECLKQVLPREPGYVGMIGSRRRVKLVREHLIAAGFLKERVDLVFMPIGLEIGAETPAEIAVSIAAQLTEARAAAGAPRCPRPPTPMSGSFLPTCLIISTGDSRWWRPL